MNRTVETSLTTTEMPLLYSKACVYSEVPQGLQLRPSGIGGGANRPVLDNLSNISV